MPGFVPSHLQDYNRVRMPFWGLIYVFLLMFFSFQALFAHLGYVSFIQQGSVTYVYRTLLVVVVFGGPFVFLADYKYSGQLKALFIYLLAILTVLYFGIIVSGRPELDFSNDRSDALGIAVESLRNGLFPYTFNTHMGNPISPLPFSFLLAMPAQLIFGRPELMNLPFWALMT